MFGADVVRHPCQPLPLFYDSLHFVRFWISALFLSLFADFPSVFYFHTWHGSALAVSVDIRRHSIGMFIHPAGMTPHTVGITPTLYWYIVTPRRCVSTLWW